MTIKNKKRTSTFYGLLVITALMAGCADRFRPYDVTEVTVTPVTISADGLNLAQLDAFLHDHRPGLLSEKVTITWTGHGTEKVAVLFYKQLLALGADRQNVDVLNWVDGVPGVGVRYLSHRVEVPECQPYKTPQLMDFHRESWPKESLSRDCFVESNRWMSLAHPERASRPSGVVKAQL